MTRKRTDEEAKEIVNNFGYILLEIYTNNWETQVILQDEYGYKYRHSLKSLIFKNGKIRFIDKGNPYTLENISVWLSINKKDFQLSENNIYNGNHEKLWFHCLVCSEDFDMSWDCIANQHQECPYCSGNRVNRYNSLAYLRSDLVNEWHPNNDIKPDEITCGSKKKIYWICSRCGYGKNKEWLTSPVCRTNQNQGCPACAGKVVTDKNRLSVLYPEIASEWHPVKNGSLTPDDVSYGNHKKVWWLCPNSHEYFIPISRKINMESNCPKCSFSKGERKIENFLLLNKIYSFPQKKFNDCRSKRLLSFDFGIQCDDGSWFMIEYHGEQHYKPVDFASKGNMWAKKKFKENKKRDKIKEKYCNDNNIQLLIIPYWEFDNIESILENALLK